MDISNLTIPPNLFYSKNPNETWKPRCLSKITPIQITEATKKKQSKISEKVAKKRKVFKRFSGPQLGRIEKVRNIFDKKKLIKKKTAILQEKSADNNNITKLPTKKEEIQLQKEIKVQDLEILKRIHVDENHKLKAKRRKGSGFKFFKSKNSEDAEEEEHQSGEHESELVSEIRDFTPPSSANTSQVDDLKTTNRQDENVQELETFEADTEQVIDGTIIESLLQNLEEGEAEAEEKEIQSEAGYTLESLIGTLEGVESEEPKIKVKKQLKPKLKGLGSNQLQIDAGQSKFGLVECKECGFSYNVSLES